jgi:DNA mismatch endonuclease, patch repair protein
VERVLKKTLPGGSFGTVPPKRSQAMGRIRGKGNRSTENRLRFALVAAGVRGWTLHPKDIPGRPDFFFPAERLAVFVDGCFWHGCRRCGHVPKTNSAFWRMKIRRNKMRDKRRTKELEQQGVRVLRFWEHELRDPCACVRRLQSALNG